MQFTARLLNNSSVRVKISCWCPPCYCWNAEQCFHCFVVKFIVYVYACRGLGPKAVNKNTYLSIYVLWPKDRGLRSADYHIRYPGPWFNIKMPSYQYRKSHCGDKTVVRSSYLHNGISYTGKTASLYWIGALETASLSAKTSYDLSHCLGQSTDILSSMELTKKLN